VHINATLFGQMITFAIFVWFTMRIIWPMLSSALMERKKRIADGLAAAEQGNKILSEAEEKARAKIQEAKQHCYKIIEEADLEVVDMIAKGRAQAQKERDEIIASAMSDLARAVKQAKADLQDQVAALIVIGAEKILERSINPEDHKQMLNSLAKKLA
jgi:F-type H+-transporting ATPase subunit b